MLRKTSQQDVAIWIDKHWMFTQFKGFKLIRETEKGSSNGFGACLGLVGYKGKGRNGFC